jgi:hypothetical protein
MKKLFLFLILGSSLHLQAQKIMNIPTKYLDSPDGTILTKSTVDVDEKNAWIVCSDRDNNKTYDKPTGSEMKTMNFMEKFYVTDEQGEFLYLYKWEDGVREGNKSNKLKKNAIAYGWAPKSKLLLWLRCMVSPVNLLGLKALPILNEGNFKTSETFIKKEGTLRLFGDPGLTRENGKAIMMFQFLYIYKREGHRLLLGKAYESNLFRIEQDALGWVDEDIVVPWNDRLCLEPNWDPEAAADRKSAGIKSMLFIKSEDAMSWKKSSSTANFVWDDDSYTERKPGTWRRFPILEYDAKNEIVKTGYVTNILNEKNQTLIDIDYHNKIEAECNAKIAEARKINLVFVIDGGMTDYMASIRYVIEKMKERKMNFSNENALRYGAVFYRDDADASCNMSVAKTPGLSSNSGELFDFIESESVKKPCGTQASRAANLGIITGLRMFTGNSISKDQTNILVLIGGAKGAENPKYTMETISGLIADTKTNFMAFQVKQGISRGHEEFPIYYSNVLRSSSKKSSQKLRASGTTSKPIPEPMYKTVGDNTHMLDYPNSSELTGLISFAPKGQVMPADDINNYIDSVMQFVETDIERKVSTMLAKIEGIGKKDVDVDVSVLRYFASINETMKDKDLIKKYVGTNYQFFIPGYTSVSIDKLGSPVFKRVLFVSDDELFDLKKTFQDLAFEGTATDVRNKIVNAYTAVLATYLGDKKAKEAINRLSPGEVWAMVTGLPSTRNSLLNKYKIAQYKNVKEVGDDEIRRLQSYLNKKYDDLKSVVGDPYLTLKLEWGTFYWIPEDYLP